MRAVKYRRISVEKEEGEGFSLEAQDMRLDAYAKSQDWTVVADYCDDGFSAKDTNRPEFQRMVRDMKSGKFDVIMVYRLDRLVRTVMDLHEMLQLMEKYDVSFRSTTEQFDTTTATGRLMITMIATLAQWERETIAERVFETMLKKSEKGERNGAPAPFGYQYVDGKLRVVPEEKKWVEYIFNRYKTHGTPNIAKELNMKWRVKTKKGEAWSDFAVRYVLRNPLYAGFIRWNYRSFAKGKLTGEEVIQKYDQEDFEPIVSEELFKETQDRLKSRAKEAFRSDSHYPFSGIARCAKCGKNFTGSKKKRKAGGVYRFYKCQGRFNFGICDVQAVAEEAIENAFLQSLSLEVSLQPGEIGETRNTELRTPEMIQAQLEKIEGKKQRTKELYIDGDIPKNEYQKRLSKLDEEALELRDAVDHAQEEVSFEEVKAVLENLKKEWPNLSDESKKFAIQNFFDHITIDVVEPTKMGKHPEPPKLEITDYALKQQ